MNCIFCSIIEKDDPHHEIVWQDTEHIAFLDAYPNHEGHLLIVPRAHTEYLFDLTDDAYDHLFAFTRTVGRKLKWATGCSRVILAVEGYEVPHVHVHLIPSDKPIKLEGFTESVSHDPKKLAEVGERLRRAFKGT